VCLSSFRLGAENWSWRRSCLADGLLRFVPWPAAGECACTFACEPSHVLSCQLRKMTALRRLLNVPVYLSLTSTQLSTLTTRSSNSQGRHS